MILTHRIYLLARCNERGYKLSDVMSCVLSQDGDIWTVDTTHPAYPRTPKSEQVISATDAAPARRRGVGTEIKYLLSRLGITAAGDCKCVKRAFYIDQMGVEWAEKNIDEIVGYLRESAKDRGLPFLDVAGRMLVKRAIRNAKKATLE